MKTQIEITPIQDVPSYLQFGITGLSATEIESALGFHANCQDDPAKVVHSWGFMANGHKCAVWDWKGSHRSKQFSAYGPLDVLRAIFGAEHVK